MEARINPVLAGLKALIVGIANDQSIAYGCAKAFRTAGADLAVTWLNEKARPMWSRWRSNSKLRLRRRSTSQSRANWKHCSRQSKGTGDASICWFTLSPSRQKPTCKEAC